MRRTFPMLLDPRRHVRDLIKRLPRLLYQLDDVVLLDVALLEVLLVGDENVDEKSSDGILDSSLVGRFGDSGLNSLRRHVELVLYRLSSVRS